MPSQVRVTMYIAYVGFVRFGHIAKAIKIDHVKNERLDLYDELRRGARIYGSPPSPPSSLATPLAHKTSIASFTSEM